MELRFVRPIIISVYHVLGPGFYGVRLLVLQTLLCFMYGNLAPG